ncbi:hypothetical protein D9619_012448 [Psilocybe cf. subviscida]|uniref:Uncharacterized protein n=1 Tax=Psilocybe cf. subviscida TaxID=2480587 RepID=A0A8H5ERC3_9AGAR|nr:hypothetical protein D9619_012448 [Psilocybe cf. subviscida]
MVYVHDASSPASANVLLPPSVLRQRMRECVAVARLKLGYTFTRIRANLIGASLGFWCTGPVPTAPPQAQPAPLNFPNFGGSNGSCIPSDSIAYNSGKPRHESRRDAPVSLHLSTMGHKDGGYELSLAERASGLVAAPGADGVSMLRRHKT